MEYLPAVSVVVPVYNVEKYIERCARSLFEQTLEDIEYIFINDCTPDNSMKLLRIVMEEYPQRQAQIKIIEFKENKGVSYARNAGLRASEGLYLIYCDPDDWVETDMYEKMYRKAIEEKADIVGCDFYIEYTDRQLKKKQPFLADPKVGIQNMLEGRLHCASWNKLIKKELYDQNGISYPYGVNMWEDVATIIKLFYYAEKVAYVEKAFYHYVKFNLNAYTKRISSASIEQMKQVVGILDNFFINLPDSERYAIVILYLKIFTRLQLVLYSNRKELHFYYRFYPEADLVILKHPTISFFYKTILWLGAHNGSIIADGLLRLKFFYNQFTIGKF